MTNKYIKELKKIINFGIDEEEILTNEERIRKSELFNSNFDYKNYLSLLSDIQSLLLSDISITEKEEIIKNVLDFICTYVNVEENVEQLPIIIKSVYYSYYNLSSLVILIEDIFNDEYTNVIDFEDVVIKYMDFLESIENEFYIHNCYSNINKFNQMLLNYLKKTDFDGVKHEDNINNPELINLLKIKINNLEERYL